MKHLWIPTFIATLWILAAATPATAATPISKDPYIGAIALDGQTGAVLWENNADAKCYPASSLKLMVLYIYLEALDLKIVDLKEPVAVSTRAYRMGGSQVYLDPRETFPVEDMLYALMVQSANDAAVALAEHMAGSVEAFVRLMNDKAKALGMNNTTFHSPHGLILSEMAGPDVSTPRDLATLSYHLLKNFPEATQYTSVTHRVFRPGETEMTSHNKLLWNFQGADGLKTGYTSVAGYTICSTAVRNGLRAIAVVAGAKDRIKRDEEAMSLLGQAFLTMAQNQASAPTAQAAVAPANSGGRAAAASNQTLQQGEGHLEGATTDVAEENTQQPENARPRGGGAGGAILLSVLSFILGCVVTASTMKIIAQKRPMFR
ncbi:MAG: D-alanyl-D-alanine carboxypeptidase [Verrucomicrobiota bacterium]|jgi:D-alanyl-D-alanine carboxypeptidase (penicillin-binding protein 5/6)|nr:D-alanyl-D-alanine carboxypeptidase [Verrucomicrobiota bacterium]